MATKQVQIGEENKTIPAFKGYKAVRAGEMVGRISEVAPGIMEEVSAWAKEYEESHSVLVTRELAKTPRFRIFGFTDEDFERNPAGITVPEPPSGEERVMHALPKLIGLARGEVTWLLALLVAPNSTLREKWNEGGDESVDEYLTQLGNDLLFDGDLDQLAELVLASWDVLQEQFSGKEERLRLLWALWEGLRQQETQANGSTPSTASSTPSLAAVATDGTPTSSSSPSPGGDSSPSGG